MRRSLAIMLYASITIHVIALSTYLLISMPDRRGASSLSGDSLALIVATNGSHSVTKPDLAQPAAHKLTNPTETSRQLPDLAVKAVASTDNESDPFPDLIPPPRSPKYPLTPKTALQKTPSALNTIEIQPSKSSPPPVAKSMTAPGSRSVVFLMDVSGSMYEDDGFSSRDMQARSMLTNLITALPSDERFTIVFYAETSQIAFPLELATEAAKKSSLHYVAMQAECGGGTNLPVGLQTAFSLHPSEIVLITDGDLNMDFRDIVSKSPPFDGDKTAIKIIGIDPREGSNDMDLLKSLADHYDGSFSPVAAQSSEPALEH